MREIKFCGKRITKKMIKQRNIEAVGSIHNNPELLEME